jgi:hypothetical protein
MGSVDGVEPCTRAAGAKWRKRNPDYERSAGRAASRRVRAGQKRMYDKQYRRSNAERLRTLALKWQRDARVSRLPYRLASNLRRRLRDAVSSSSRSGSAVRDLGCTIPELKAHLERQFQPGMTWDNWSPTVWHIDHKRPLASFDLTDREQFLKACHYTNLQPLWAEQNLAKGAREAA